MKKWIALLLVFAMCISFAGCGTKATDEPVNTGDTQTSESPDDGANTEAPQDTDAPATEEPSDETEAPSDATEAPDDSDDPATEAPADETGAPVNSEAPATEAPATNAPAAEATQAPGTPANMVVFYYGETHKGVAESYRLDADTWVEYGILEAGYDPVSGPNYIKLHVTMGISNYVKPNTIAQALADIIPQVINQRVESLPNPVGDIVVTVNYITTQGFDYVEDPDTGDGEYWYYKRVEYIGSNGSISSTKFYGEKGESTFDEMPEVSEAEYKALGGKKSFFELYQDEGQGSGAGCGVNITVESGGTTENIGISLHITKCKEGATEAEEAVWNNKYPVKNSNNSK